MLWLVLYAVDMIHRGPTWISLAAWLRRLWCRCLMEERHHCPHLLIHQRLSPMRYVRQTNSFQGQLFSHAWELETKAVSWSNIRPPLVCNRKICHNLVIPHYIWAKNSHNMNWSPFLNVRMFEISFWLGIQNTVYSKHCIHSIIYKLK